MPRATGTTPTGKVILKIGATTVGSAYLHSGSVRITTNLSKGTHHITAYYLGSVRARTSTSPVFNVKVI